MWHCYLLYFLIYMLVGFDYLKDSTIEAIYPEFVATVSHLRITECILASEYSLSKCP